jgi:hypothetical protein
LFLHELSLFLEDIFIPLTIQRQFQAFSFFSMGKKNKLSNRIAVLIQEIEQFLIGKPNGYHKEGGDT